MPEDSILSIREVTRSFGGIVALNSVSCEVRGSDGIFGIVGPNGAGKSVLLNCITGLYSLNSGSIHFLGRRIDGLRPHKLAEMGISRSFQATEHFHEVRVAEYLVASRPRTKRASVVACALSLRSASRSERAALQLAYDTLEMVGLAAYRHHRLGDLPYGLRKSVDIARAIATSPALLLLDEPTAGVSLDDRSVIAEMIRGIGATGVSVIVVDHDVAFIEELCAKLLVLNFGTVIASGPPAEVLRDSSVRTAYLGLV
jgi:branched-chain amino acid transport system ATP-binding protein